MVAKFKSPLETLETHSIKFLFIKINNIWFAKGQLGQNLENAKRFLAFDNAIAPTKETTDGGVNSSIGAWSPSTSRVVVINTSSSAFAIDQCNKASFSNNIFQPSRCLSSEKKPM